MKLILKLKDVKEGSTVTKPTGVAPYLVKDSIRFYGQVTSNQLVADPGVRFLVGSNGTVSGVPDTTKVAVEGKPKELLEVLQYIIDRREESETSRQ